MHHDEIQPIFAIRIVTWREEMGDKSKYCCDIKVKE